MTLKLAIKECFHINLVKQVGSLDDGPAKSTRYRCKECGAFLVTKPYVVEVSIGPALKAEEGRRGIPEMPKELISNVVAEALIAGHEHRSLTQARIDISNMFHEWLVGVWPKPPDPMAGLVTSDKEVEYLDERGEAEKVSFEGLDGCTRSTQNVGGWYDTAVWWKRNFLRIAAAQHLKREQELARCNRCQANLCEHDNCTDWTCARACSKCAKGPREQELSPFAVSGGTPPGTVTGWETPQSVGFTFDEAAAQPPQELVSLVAEASQRSEMGTQERYSIWSCNPCGWFRYGGDLSLADALAMQRHFLEEHEDYGTAIIVDGSPEESKFAGRDSEGR